MSDPELSFLKYLKITRDTTFSLFKICTWIFSGIATVITIAIEITKGSQDGPIYTFILCELFGILMAVMIWTMAILDGYFRAKTVISTFYQIPEKARDDFELELIKRPMNDQYWYLQFQIVRMKNGRYYEISEKMKKELLDEWTANLSG